MKASRLILTLLLASSVAVVELAAQQTKADQKPIEEVKAKAEAGDAESQWNSVVATTRAKAW
jgi:Flp pilus assembly protein CpaB